MGSIEDKVFGKITDKMLKDAAGKLMGAAASKLGGGLGGMVLDLVGLGGDPIDEVSQKLDQLNAEMQKLDGALTQLMDLEKWDKATRDFPAIVVALKTDMDNIKSYLQSGLPKGQIKQDIAAYVRDPQNNFAQYDKDLTLIDDILSGRNDNIVGPAPDPLITTYLDTHWKSIRDDDPAKVIASLENAYVQLVHIQLALTNLVVAYYEGKAKPDHTLAEHTRKNFVDRTADQYLTLYKAMPKALALHALPSPTLELSFDTLTIGSKTIYRAQGRLGLFSPQKDTSWQLVRTGTRGGAPVYRLDDFYFYSAQEKTFSIPTSQVSVGPPGHEQLRDEDFVDAPLVGAVMSAKHPYEFTLHCDTARDVYRLRDAQGNEFGLVNYGTSGDMLQLTARDSTKDWGMKFGGLDLLPRADTPVLSAWSRAFSKNPNGEGRFTPGFHVRYRVIYLNRFGESPKSPWMKLGTDDSTQISGRYTNNGRFYMAQIKVSSGGGRAEGYRLFRQFFGEDEEEISFDQVGDPQHDSTVILDDKTP